MSTRSRTRPRAVSYTARLQQHTAAPRCARPVPAWLTDRRLPALLALAAEAGHLAAAFVEWPGSVTRGVFHILAAAALGLVSVSVYFGQSKLGLISAIVVALSLVISWPVGLLIEVSSYRDYPLPAAIAATAADLSVAVALHWTRPAK